MRAVVCERHGLPEDLVVCELLEPQPGRGQVRIGTRAAGVNFPDALIIQDLYQAKPPLPFSPGSEVAGLIEAVGEGVTALKAGDRVAAMTTFGAFAGQVVIDADRCVPVPDDMPFDVAAIFTLVYGTSYYALNQRAALQPGETVLVLGAAGGVGLAAVEVAKAMGAHVIAAASSEEKLALARTHGADETINYSTQDLRETVKAFTRGNGVDVVYDPVGGKLADPAFRSIGWNGRYLVVGFAAGDIPALPLNLPLVKGASIVGVFWGSFTVRERARHLENVDQLYAWYADGKLRPHISRRFPLLQGAAAIRWMMDRKTQGKIVLIAD